MSYRLGLELKNSVEKIICKSFDLSSLIFNRSSFADLHNISYNTLNSNYTQKHTFIKSHTPASLALLTSTARLLAHHSSSLNLLDSHSFCMPCLQAAPLSPVQATLHALQAIGMSFSLHCRLPLEGCLQQVAIT